MTRYRNVTFYWIISLVLGILIPQLALARPGNLALINLDPPRSDVVQQASKVVSPYLGGWARQSDIAAYLEGETYSGALPTGDVGKELVILVERVRTRQSSNKDLTDLGRLLGVDYLLLLKPKPQELTAQLFSVQRQTYAPQSFHSAPPNAQLLLAYLQEQTRAAPTTKSSKSHWWIWAIAVGLGGLTLGLALSNHDETAGDLRIRVTR